MNPVIAVGALVVAGAWPTGPRPARTRAAVPTPQATPSNPVGTLFAAAAPRPSTVSGCAMIVTDGAADGASPEMAVSHDPAALCRSAGSAAA